MEECSGTRIIFYPPSLNEKSYSFICNLAHGATRAFFVVPQGSEFSVNDMTRLTETSLREYNSLCVLIFYMINLLNSVVGKLYCHFAIDYLQYIHETRILLKR